MRAARLLSRVPLPLSTRPRACLCALPCRAPRARRLARMGAGGAPVRRAGVGAAAPLASRAPAAARAQQRPLRRRVVVVTGPTASGKTSLSVELALRLNGEVVSADSVQVYERLDVGAAKATREERRGVPHHLLDVRSPLDGKDFSAGCVCARARERESGRRQCF